MHWGWCVQIQHARSLYEMGEGCCRVCDVCGLKMSDTYWKATPCLRALPVSRLKYGGICTLHTCIRTDVRFCVCLLCVDWTLMINVCVCVCVFVCVCGCYILLMLRGRLFSFDPKEQPQRPQVIYQRLEKGEKGLKLVWTTPVCLPEWFSYFAAGPITWISSFE